MTLRQYLDTIVCPLRAEDEPGKAPDPCLRCNEPDCNERGKGC